MRLEPLEDRTLLATSGFAVNTGSAGGGTAGTAVTVDAAGNVYTNAVLPPGSYSFLPVYYPLGYSGPSELKVYTDEENILVKYSSSGQLLWSSNPALWNAYAYFDPVAGYIKINYGFQQQSGLGGVGEMPSMAIDAAGNLDVATDNAGYNSDIVKIDGTTGAPIWTFQLVGSGINALALDSAGNVFVTGGFSGSLSLGFSTVAQPPSASLFSLQSPYSWGDSSYIVELDSNGQFVWGGGLLVYPPPAFRNFFVYANGIATDGAGNVYLGGTFTGSVNFDPNGGVYALGSFNSHQAGGCCAPPPDTFVLKLNPAHQLVWVDDMRGVDYDIGTPWSFADGITADAAGNVFLTGGHFGDVNFNPGPGDLEIPNQEGPYVEKLDTSGAFQWVTSAFSYYTSQGVAVALDSAGNVYTTGEFSGVTNFGTAVLGANPNENDPYVWQLDANGNPIWAGSMIGSPGSPVPEGGARIGCHAITIDSVGDIFVTGGAQGGLPLRILPGPGEVDLDTAYYLSGGVLLPIGQLGFLVKLIQNTPPTADAGGPYSIYEGDSLTLNAGASTDPDGDTLSYSWDINGDGVYGDATGVSPTPTWSQLQALGIGPGTYNVSVQVDDGNGFVVSSAATTLTVQPVPTAITLTAPGVTYGTDGIVNVAVANTATPTTPTGNVSLIVDGMSYSSNLTGGTATFDVGILNAGDHSLTASYAAQDIFAASAASGTLTITPRPITVSADSGQNKVYGTADPASFSYTISSGNLGNGDGFTGALSRVPGETVGSYPITQGTLALSSNYTLTYQGASFSITPTTPTVKVTDAGGTYNGSAFPATATVAGVNHIPGASLENVTPTLTYYPGATTGGTPLSRVPFLPGTYTVVASFAGSQDYTSASATVTFTIKVPTTSIIGPTIGVPGQPLTYGFSVLGPTQGITFSINYGDGTMLNTNPGGPSVKLDHTYAAAGSFTIQVTATDTNGVVSQLAMQQVNISTVAMEADASGGTALAVGGNAAGGDTIDVSATDTTGKTVNLTINKISLGTFTPTGHILVYGQGGKDKITLKPYVVGNSTYYYIQVPAFLYGEGTGGDKISAAGSAANNVLSGHGANEVLTGGQGRDLLIGGTGAATLNAGTLDDILIGGWTNYDISSAGMTYDQKFAALNSVMAEWGSTDSYLTRLNVLAGYLNTNTVHDNYLNGVAVVDQLLGNAKQNDWFFAGINDYVTGTNKNDVITTIN